MKRIIAIVLLTIMAVTGLSACALSEFLTPTPIDQRSVRFASEAGVCDANSYRGWANLAKARQLEKDVDAAYDLKVQKLQHDAEILDLDYGILNEVNTRNTKIGVDREQFAFGETGLLSTVLPLCGFSGAAGLLGLMRKRPGDVTPGELDTVLTQAGVDLKEKDRQMLEIVNGVAVFMDRYDNQTEPGSALRSALTKATNTDTKKVVAAIQAG